MKRLSIFFATAVAFVAVACTKNDGPDKPENQEPVLPELFYNVTEAGAFFAGNTDENGNQLEYDAYQVILLGDGIEITDNGFNGVGAATYIDMNTPTNGGNPMRILQGTYGVWENGKKEDYCFYPGEISDASAYPTYVYYRKDEQSDGIYYVVTDGTITVKIIGDEYKIKCSFKTEIATFIFNYKGSLQFQDITEGGEGGDSEGGVAFPDHGGTPGERSTYKKIEFNDYNLGVQVYYGYYYDENGDPITGYSNWCVQLFDSEDTEGYLNIEINTVESATTAIPAGTYSFKEANPGDFSTASLVPEALVAGIIQYGYFYGTWFFDIDHPIDAAGTFYAYGVTDGEVDVVVNKDNSYKISYTLYDDVEAYVLKGVSNVKNLDFIDGTAEEENLTVLKSDLSRGVLRNSLFSSKKTFHNSAVKARRAAKSSASFAPSFVKAYKRAR